MRVQKLPVIGMWYEDNEVGLFRVIAIDDDHRTIERQYASGEIDELDYDLWRSSNFRTASCPDDAHLAFDDMEQEDGNLIENCIDRTHGRPWEEYEYDVFSYMA